MADLPVTYRGTVYPWQLDHMGHMNVQHYVGMFDQSTWALMALIGMTATYFRERERGMAALDQRISYMRELRAGDIVENRSGILEVRDKTIKFFHEMRNTNTGGIAARTELVGVFMDTAARKSLPLPTDIRNRAIAMISTESALADGATN